MNDDDPLSRAPEPTDRPVHLEPAAPRPRARRVRSTGNRLLRWWLATGLLLVAACAAATWFGLQAFDLLPIHVVMDGQDVSSDFNLEGLTTGVIVLLATGAALLVMLMVLVLPLVLVISLAALTLLLACSLIAPLAVVMVVLAPLWLVPLVLWRVLRRRPSPPAPPSATIAA